VNPATTQSDFEKHSSNDPGGGAGVPHSPPRPSDGPRPLVFDPERPRPNLTEREKQILRLVCDGMTNAEIASQLGISPETVKSELKRMFRKIDVRNRTQAAVLLVRQRLL